MSERKAVDWEAVEREYRAGQLSLREIARAAGISDTAIRKRAKAEGWERDLTERVQQEARARLVRDAGSQEGSQSRRANEREAVETAAARQVEVVRQHRQAIGRGRDLTMRLIDELSASTSHIGELEDMIADETKADGNVTRRNAMLRAVSLSSRSGAIRDLSTAAKNWVTLERQAFNVPEDKAADADDPFVLQVIKYADDPAPQ